MVCCIDASTPSFYHHANKITTSRDLRQRCTTFSSVRKQSDSNLSQCLHLWITFLGLFHIQIAHNFHIWYQIELRYISHLFTCFTFGVMLVSLVRYRIALSMIIESRVSLIISSDSWHSLVFLIFFIVENFPGEATIEKGSFFWEVSEKILRRFFFWFRLHSVVLLLP